MGHAWLGVWLVGADGLATNTNRCQAQLHDPPQLHRNAMDCWMPMITGTLEDPNNTPRLHAMPEGEGWVMRGWVFGW